MLRTLVRSTWSVLSVLPRSIVHGTVALFSRIPAPPPRAPPVEYARRGILRVLATPKPGMHNMDVVLFHGLQLGNSYEHAYYWTWATDSPNSVCWPVHLLAQDFPGARIMSVQYNTRAEDNSGQMTVEALAEAVLQDLCSAHVGKQGPQAPPVPVILVGHSLGGIVLKQVCIYASSLAAQPNGLGDQMLDYARHFLQHVRMIAFFSTPHNGSHMAALAAAAMRASPVLRLLAPFNREAAVNNAAFQLLRQDTRLGINWNVFQLHETVAMGALGVEGLVVSEASGRAGVDHHRFYSVPNTDHTTICKPSSRDDGQYMRFVSEVKAIAYQWVEVRGNNIPGHITYWHGMDSGGVNANRPVFIARHLTLDHTTPGTTGRHFKSIAYELTNVAVQLPPNDPYDVLHTPYFGLFFAWVPMVEVEQCRAWAESTQSVHIGVRRKWIPNAFDVCKYGGGIYIVRPSSLMAGEAGARMREATHLPLVTDTCFGKVLEGFKGTGSFALPLGPCRSCGEIQSFALRWDEMEILMQRA